MAPPRSTWKTRSSLLTKWWTMTMASRLKTTTSASLSLAKPQVKISNCRLQQASPNKKPTNALCSFSTSRMSWPSSNYSRRLGRLSCLGSSGSQRWRSTYSWAKSLANLSSTRATLRTCWKMWNIWIARSSLPSASTSASSWFCLGRHPRLKICRILNSRNCKMRRLICTRWFISATSDHLKVSQRIILFTIMMIGLAVVYNRYQRMAYGYCMRAFCDKQPVIPIGMSDVLRKGRVKVYCPKCEEVYVPSP